jgi:hypothetical protein
MIARTYFLDPETVNLSTAIVSNQKAFGNG